MPKGAARWRRTAGTVECSAAGAANLGVIGADLQLDFLGGFNGGYDDSLVGGVGNAMPSRV